MADCLVLSILCSSNKNRLTTSVSLKGKGIERGDRMREHEHSCERRACAHITNFAALLVLLRTRIHTHARQSRDTESFNALLEELVLVKLISELLF
jgi:hypothetical protein